MTTADLDRPPLALPNTHEGMSFSEKNMRPDIQVGPYSFGKLPATYDAWVSNARDALKYIEQLELRRAMGLNLVLTPEDVSRSRDLVMRGIVTQVAQLQARLSDGGHYDLGLINPDPTQAYSAGKKQISAPLRTQSDYYALTQKTYLTSKERVICRDFATFSEKYFRDIGLEMVRGTDQKNPLIASTALMNVGVDHMYTLLKDTRTKTIYLVTADQIGGPGKVFIGRTEKELRERYQTEVLRRGRGGNSFNGASFQDGQFTGIAPRTAWEEHLQSTAMGGLTPFRLMDVGYTSIDTAKLAAGGVNVRESIANYVNRTRLGGWVDFDTFIRTAQYKLSAGGGPDHSVTTLAEGFRLSGPEMQVADGFRARVFVAADVALATGLNADGSPKVPQLRGNSLIGGHLEYKGEKWSFTTDAGLSYELLNPSMYSPQFKMLPSGEFVMLTTKYQGDGYEVFARMKHEQYLNTRSTTLSGDVKIGDTTLRGSIGSEIIKTPMGGEQTRQIGLSVSNAIAPDMIVTGGLDRSMSTTGGSLETVHVSIQQDLLGLIESGGKSSQKQWKEFCQKYGLKVAPADFDHPDWLQTLSARIYIANREMLFDNQKIRNYFLSFGLELKGGTISIQPGSTLYNSTSFRASLGLDDLTSLGGAISLTHRRDLTASTHAELSLSQDYVSTFGRFAIKTGFATGDGSVNMIGAFVQSGNLAGRAEVSGGLTASSIRPDGAGSEIGIGSGTGGVFIEFGNTTMLFGDTSQRTRVGMTGIAHSVSQNPGKTIVNETGETVGQFEWMYQVLSKSPADRASIKNIMRLLSEIGSQKTITISEEFARELRSRSELKKFETYLKNNQTLFTENSSLGSIHFESTSDWLGSFRGVEGVEMTPVTGHALIRSIGDGAVLSSGVLSDTPKKETSEILSNSLDLLKKHQISIKSDYQVTEQELGAINHLIRHAISAQQVDRIKNITIRLEPKTEGQTGSLGWDEKKRILTLPQDLLQFVPPEQVLAIENTASGDQKNTLQSLLTEYEIHNLNTIEIVADNDARFLDLDGNQTMLGVKNRDGKTYAYKSQIERMILLSQKSKTPDGLGFFEKREFDDLIGQWKKASIYPLDQFDLYLNNKMSDLKKSTAKMARYAGVSVLQGFVPKGAIEYTDGAKTLTLIREQTNTKEKIGEVRITLKEDGSISIQTSNIIDGTSQGTIYTIDPADKASNVIQTIEADQPELFALLFGTTGTNITSGKKDRVIGVIEKMFSLHRDGSK